MILRSPELLPLSDDFRREAEKLAGKNFSEHPEVYRQFLSDFGTHYFDRTSFGDAVMLQLSIDDAFYRRYKPIWFNRATRAIFTHLYANEPRPNLE